MTIKDFLKIWFGWVIGLLIGVCIVSLLKNGEVDWGNFAALSKGGLIGTMIGLGIRIIKNDDIKIHH